MRQIAKSLLNGFAILAILPLAACFIAGATIHGRQNAFPGYSQLLSLIPGYCGQYLAVPFIGSRFPSLGKISALDLARLCHTQVRELAIELTSAVFACWGMWKSQQMY